MNPEMLEILSKFSIAGLPIIAITPFIIEQLKKQKWSGVNNDNAGLVSVIIFAILMGGAATIEYRPDLSPVVLYPVLALIGGLAASGLYSQNKVAKENREKK